MVLICVLSDKTNQSLVGFFPVQENIEIKRPDDGGVEEEEEEG